MNSTKKNSEKNFLTGDIKHTQIVGACDSDNCNKYQVQRPPNDSETVTVTCRIFESTKKKPEILLCQL